jgi:hypothetical protein
MTDYTPGSNHTAEPTSQLLTIAEAALLLRAPVATLRYWRHLGTGPHSFRSVAASSTAATTCTPGSTPSAGRPAPTALDRAGCVKQY